MASRVAEIDGSWERASDAVAVTVALVLVGWGLGSGAAEVGWTAFGWTAFGGTEIKSQGDGFMLSPIDCPGAIEDFVDHVVPEMQRRGRFRPDYSGRTIRDHLRQTW